MKKAIITISVLCASLMLFGTMKGAYATNLPDVEPQKIQAKEDTQITKEENKKVEVQQVAVKEEQPVVKTEIEQVKEEQPVVKENKTLTKEEALQLVIDYEPILTYIYQGDENTYSCIKEKGITGYVFLPTCDGDMAYLVDKETANIYFFHPSGYFELLK